MNETQLNIENSEEHGPEITKKGKIVFGIYEWVGELAVAIVVMVIVCSLFFRIVTVNGISMEPNYYENDRVMVTSLMPQYNAGDVVVIVDYPQEPMIKRIIATEGQVVDIDEATSSVTVDGVVFEDAVYGIEEGITTGGNTALDTLTFPQTVPDGHVFVLGDNRIVSKDSRYTEIGMVDTREIIGKSVLKVYPFSDFGTVT